MAEDEIYFNINEEIREDFLNVTQHELVLSVHYSSIICVLCLRSLQMASTLKSQFIENQKKFLINELDVQEDESQPEFSDLEPKIKEEIIDDETVYDEEVGTVDTDINTEMLYPRQQFEVNKRKQKSSSYQEYECDICHKKFKNVNSVKQHRQLHDKPSALIHTVSCGICGKSYKGKAGLNAHMLIHSTPQFNCDICNMEFYDKQRYQYHIMSKHLKQKNFQCNECSKSYFKKSDLKRHVLAAHVREKYACTFSGCGMTFNLEEKCRTHIYEAHPFERIEDLFKVMEKVDGRTRRH